LPEFTYFFGHTPPHAEKPGIGLPIRRRFTFCLPAIHALLHEINIRADAGQAKALKKLASPLSGRATP